MEKLYFSDEIARKLALMHQSGLVMLEAPAGYGKTTAVRWALKETPVEALHWFTAVSFLQDAGLDWLIRQIGQLDPAAGTALRQLGFLNRSNVSTAADILMNLRVEEACYLIFDNFQLIGDNWPAALLQALADRRPDGLHVILISQNFGKLRTVFENASGVCAFTARDFLLTRRDIAAYGRQLGLELTRQQQETIYAHTEGWAAAVSLYLNHLLENGGTLTQAWDMDALLREFFQRLREKRKKSSSFRKEMT